MTASWAELPRRCAVLGSPIAHSLSPTLHRAAYAHLGLGWSYGRVEIAAADLAGFVDGLDHLWRGLSLTMPLKEAALDLGEVDDLARLAGAGNTLVLEGPQRRVYNTDIGGLVWAVRRMSSAPVRRVTILGAGATARSALVSALELGADTVTVVARTPAKAEPLVALARGRDLRIQVQAWASPLPESDLVISTAPAHAADDLADTAARSAPVVFDAIYAPWPTVLAETAADAGATVVSGLDLLVGQALLQIELMTARSVPAEVLYTALGVAHPASTL